MRPGASHANAKGFDGMWRHACPCGPGVAYLLRAHVGQVPRFKAFTAWAKEVSKQQRPADPLRKRKGASGSHHALAVVNSSEQALVALRQKVGFQQGFCQWLSYLAQATYL